MYNFVFVFFFFRERKCDKMAGGRSNGGATDSDTVASLLDPACGIPFDIHFDLEDEAGTSLGTLGGHKSILALKSPVFKAMLFGPLKESGDHVRIKATSMFAFKTMLEYIHDVETEWWPWSLDLGEMIRITDLAERYHLHGLHKKIINHAKDFLFPKDRLVEVAQVAEECYVHTELSETLLKTCADFLLSILESPQDFNNFVQEWSGKSGEESGVAFRLLARIDQHDVVYVNHVSHQTRAAICHLRNIRINIQPRLRLLMLKTMLEDAEDNPREEMMESINANDGDGCVFTDSLWKCQKMDAEKAALEGNPLTLDTLVEEQFTHETSVRLHLDLIRLTTADGQFWDETEIENIWTEMLRSIPEVKSIILLWLSNNGELFDHVGHHLLAKKMRSCEEALMQLPGYASAFETYTL